MEQAKLVELVVQEVLKKLAAGGSKGSVVRVYAWRSLELTDRLMPLLKPWHGDDVKLVCNGEEEEKGGYAARILPFLSCTDMADMAAGAARSGIPALVLQALLHGETVDVVTYEYREYATTAPQPLYALYESYRKTLEGFGLKEFRVKQPDSVRCQDSLVTAKTVEEAALKGIHTLLAAPAAKVTPLAQETAERLGVALVKR